MRRGLLALLALVSASSLSSAQAPVAPPHSTPVQLVQTLQTLRGLPPATTLSADDVVTRLMSFDHNNDGRVAIAELSERMHPLMSRGDTDADGTLNLSEIRALALAPRTVVQVQGGRGFGMGGYSFGDDVGVSSRMHIEGALDDLRLTTDRRDRALPIVTAYAETIEQTAKTDLVKQMEPLMAPEQLTALTTALNSQMNRQMVVRTNAGEVQRFTVKVGGADLTRRVEAMQLGEAKTEQAKRAIEDFKARSRIGTEAERSGLMAQLKDVLSGEELDNYRAALERRPVVASGSQFVFSGNAVINRAEIIDVARPAVLIEKAFPPNGVSVR